MEEISKTDTGRHEGLPHRLWCATEWPWGSELSAPAADPGSPAASHWGSPEWTEPRDKPWTREKKEATGRSTGRGHYAIMAAIGVLQNCTRPLRRGSKPDDVYDLSKPGPSELRLVLPASVRTQLPLRQRSGEKSPPNELHQPIDHLLDHFLWHTQKDTARRTNKVRWALHKEKYAIIIIIWYIYFFK